MKGLVNIGNTCYLNAGLQMLLQNNDFCLLIIKYSNESEILNKIKDNILEYYDNTNSNLTPIKIKEIVENSQNIFIGSHQHDSIEFIIFLLDIIEKEILKINPSSTELKDIFYCFFNVRIKCKITTCLNICNVKENNSFLILDIDENCNTLDDAYRKFKLGELLDNDNKYFCEKCGIKRVASKRTEIVLWPNHLLVWLKRYSNNNSHINKNSKQIKIPLYWRHNMILYGAIVHSGSLFGGHYVYVGKNNNNWYLFNDSSVSIINNDEQLEDLLNNAYCLYYKSN